MQEDGLVISAQHARSRRWAILEDDGRAAWLYLTEPDSTKPVADCWLYNSVPAPQERNFKRGETPVVPLTHTHHAAPFPAPAVEEVALTWSPDGNSVAALFKGQVMGFIANLGPRGHSRLLCVAGPYGEVLDDALYERVFSDA